MKNKILSKVRDYKCIFEELPKCVPSNAVVDAPIAGNGDIGIVYNSCDNRIEVLLSKNDFWKAAPEKDFNGGAKPIGKLSFSFDKFEGCRYYAEQNIINSKLYVQLTKDNISVKMETFVPRNENMVVINISASGGDIFVRSDLIVATATDASYNSGYDKCILSLNKAYNDDSLLFNSEVAVRSRFIGEEKDTVIKDHQTVTMIASIVTNYDDASYKEKAESLIYNTNSEQLKKIAEEHEKWWTRFWESSSIDIPSEPYVEKKWYVSHYIMACCSGNKQFSPGILGNWITTDTPMAGNDYHLNYNYEAPWWGLYSSNKIDITEPYDTPLIEYIPSARIAARNKLQCNGLYMVVGIGPKGLPVSLIIDNNGNDDVSFWGQKSNASYAAVNMIIRYYSTYDNDYAMKTAYPYLKEVAAFWEDYLVYQDGRYFIYNDSIHENEYAAVHIFPWVKNNTDYANDCNPLLSLGLIRLIFKALIVMHKELNENDPRATKWQHILQNISPFPTQIKNGKKVFRYTETGMDWCKSNSLGIQHIYPAGQIGLGSDPELLETGLNTLVELNRWDDYNAFSTFFTAAVRLGYDSDIILMHLNEELKKYSLLNGFIFHGGGGIEDCSGVPTCINEMLLQSYEGVLRFFPVWNRSKDAAFYQLRAYGAFLVSAEIKSGIIRNVKILSEKGRDCVVHNDFGENVSVFDITDEKKLVNIVKEKESIKFSTVPNRIYSIE